MGKVAEFIGFGDKGGFAVYFDDSADAAVVDVGVDKAFASFAVAALFGFGQAFFAHGLEGFIEVAFGLDEGVFGVSKANAREFFEFFDLFDRDVCHFSP